MKKIISLILTITVVFAAMGSFSVSADISVNSGKGVSLAFKQIARTSPSSGTFATLSALDGTGYDSAYRYTYLGGDDKTIVQIRLDFENTGTVAAGDYVYMSFYYRFNDDDTHELPSYIQRRQYANSASGKLALDGGVSTEWQKASFVTTSEAAVESGSDITQILLMGITTNTPLSMDIANPVCVYFGAVTGDDAEAQIQAEIDKSAFTSITVADTTVDLSANPVSYTTTEEIAAEDITAVGYHDSAIVKILSSETDENVTYTVTSYAIGYDFTAEDDTRYSTYTVIASKPQPPISVNDGKGLSMEFAKITRNSPSSGLYALINKITDTGFKTAYRYEYIEATKTNVQLSLNFVNTQAVTAGDYFHMSFYYRFIDDDTYNLPASLQYRANVNSNDGKAAIGSGFTSGEWRKASIIVTASADIAADTAVSMRYIVNIASGDKFCMEIAEPTCVYFGAVAADDAEAAINAQIGKSEISGITIGDADIDLASNPAGYTTEETVSFDDINVSGYHDPCVVKMTSAVSGDTVTYSITAYALGYNFLDSTDTHKSVYTITAKAPEYDLYSYDYSSSTDAGYYVKALFDNNTAEALPMTYIAAAYNKNDDLIGTNFLTGNISAGTTKNELSTTIEEIDETVCTIKIFVWDGMTDIMPIMKNKAIDILN